MITLLIAGTVVVLGLMLGLIVVGIGLVGMTSKVEYETKYSNEPLIITGKNYYMS